MRCAVRSMLAVPVLAMAFTPTAAHAIVLSDTVATGLIGEFGVDAGVPLLFDLGGTFSSITKVTFTFEPCDDCLDTIGTGEEVVLTLGPDTFFISNVGLAATIVTSLSFSPGLGADLLDGGVAGLIWMDELPGFEFDSRVSSSILTLSVEGEPGAAVPEPASGTLLLLGLAATRAAFRKR